MPSPITSNSNTLDSASFEDLHSRIRTHSTWNGNGTSKPKESKSTYSKNGRPTAAFEIQPQKGNSQESICEEKDYSVRNYTVFKKTDTSLSNVTYTFGNNNNDGVRVLGSRIFRGDISVTTQHTYSDQCFESPDDNFGGDIIEQPVRTSFSNEQLVEFDILVDTETDQLSCTLSLDPDKSFYKSGIQYSCENGYFPIQSAKQAVANFLGL